MNPTKPFPIDHDLHIHTLLSSCSNDPEQTTGRILRYARENGFRQVAVTDHFWDETVEGANSWYRPQDFAHIVQSLPLPKADGVEFLFGCEAEMDKDLRLGIARETIDKFDFVVIPTTHLHMRGFTIAEEDDPLPRRAAVYVKRFEKLLSMDLPFRKIGIAHLTCYLIAKKPSYETHIELLDLIPDATFYDLFRETAKVGAGVELNFPLSSYDEKQRDRVLRPYRIAHDCGCRFYLGSDAHHPDALDRAPANFAAIVEALGLTEADRFDPLA
ncbi:MAG: PHP domain-containing protein [Clostridia bacterium]|nr:PHP domain-containing protein [Clostridia bacterium]